MSLNDESLAASLRARLQEEIAPPQQGGQGAGVDLDILEIQLFYQDRREWLSALEQEES